MSKRSTLPIENLPATRPRCPWCNRQLRPVVNETRDGVAVYERGAIITRRVFLRWDAYDQLFDRLVCARSFAVASYKGGYRRAKA